MSRIQHPADFPVFQPEGDFLLPTSLATGPWYPGTQHGSAMMLMVALAAERHPGEIPRQVTRLTVDMMKAAPIGLIETGVEIRKGGRNLEVLDISIRAGGDECVRASALRFRLGEVPVPERVKYQGRAPQLPPPLPFDLFAHAAEREGFHHALEIRVDVNAEPGLLWFRLKQPVLPGQPVTPLQRVAAAADWTYSVPTISHHVRTLTRFGKQSFYGINPDTTLNLHRPAVGEWIGIQVQSTYDDLGAGTVMGQIFDQHGPLGYSTQSILIRGPDAAPKAG